MTSWPLRPLAVSGSKDQPWSQSCCTRISLRGFGVEESDYGIVGCCPRDSIHRFPPTRVARRNRRCIHENMGGEARASIGRYMPTSFHVWRGVDSSRGRVQGLSWTIDRDKAVWFARRFLFRGHGRLVHGKVERSDVHAFFQGRNESEIVASEVKVLKIDKLPPVSDSKRSAPG